MSDRIDFSVGLSPLQHHVLRRSLTRQREALIEELEEAPRSTPSEHSEILDLIDDLKAVRQLLEFFGGPTL